MHPQQSLAVQGRLEPAFPGAGPGHFKHTQLRTKNGDDDGDDGDDDDDDDGGDDDDHDDDDDDDDFMYVSARETQNIVYIYM